VSVKLATMAEPTMLSKRSWVIGALVKPEASMLAACRSSLALLVYVRQSSATVASRDDGGTAGGWLPAPVCLSRLPRRRNDSKWIRQRQSAWQLADLTS
jgi:hypothetical protein